MSKYYLGNVHDGRRSLSDYMKAEEQYGMEKQAKQQSLEANDFEMKRQKIQGALELLNRAVDEPSYQQAKEIARQMGMDLTGVPENLDPIWVANNKRILQQGLDDMPASVKEYNFYNNLNRDEQERYLQMKRANPYINLGDTMTQISPITKEPVSSYPINPKISDRPDYQAEVEFAKAKARELGETEGKSQAMDVGVDSAIDKLREYNNNTFDMAYADNPVVRGVSRMSTDEEMQTKSKNMDLLKQARLELAAPLAKQLGVNPTDKDFQASLDRIFDTNSTKESRAAQIEALAQRIEAKKGNSPQPSVQSWEDYF